MISVLFVCAGNICRSPMAEGFTRQLLEPLSGEFGVSSAGIMGWEGSAATPESISVASERGVDISPHVAHKLTSSDVARADLIVCMAGEHRDAVLKMASAVGSKTFTLKELVRLLEGLPRPEESEEADARLILRRIQMADELRRSGFTGDPADEDVNDPIGMTEEIYRAIGWDIDEWCRRLVAGLLAHSPIGVIEQERGA
jgi:protein-tyrosine phosphatase